MNNKKRRYAFEVGYELLKNAKTKEELEAKKSYITRLIAWGILLVLYLLVIFVPQLQWILNSGNKAIQWIILIIPIVLAAIEVSTYGKAWHTYLERHRIKQ